MWRIALGDAITFTGDGRNFESFANLFDVFAKFCDLASFSKFSDVLGPVRMRSDMFGSIRMHSDAPRSQKMQSDSFGNFRNFLGFLAVLGCFSSFGDYFC